MEKYNLMLNIIPFTAPVKEMEFSFYPDKQDGFYPIHKDDLKGIIEAYMPEDKMHYGYFYTDFLSPKPGAVTIKVDLTQSVHFANHYYRWLILRYFENIADVTYPNFIKEIELWFHDQSQNNQHYNVYQVYTLKVQYGHVTDAHELVLSYDGTSKVLNQSVKDLIGFDTDKLNHVNCGGKLYKYKYMPPHFKQDLDKIFPVISNPLKPEFNILFDKPSIGNRYPDYFKKITAFFNTYLNTADFKQHLPLSEKGFYYATEEQISRTNDGSNELLFGKGTGTDPQVGMKIHGPYKPSRNNTVHFFFIYCDKDRASAVKQIYGYFTEGFFKDEKKEHRIFPNLADYIKQPFHIEKSDSISFISVDTAVDEVRKQLAQKDFKQGITYVAIYISPVSKNELNADHREIYYRIKEMLLQRGITSQVIFKDNISSPSFNYFLPNIETALLAKIDGIPWRLNRAKTDELIVGIGAFYSVSKKTKYVGSAFSFNNDGVFQNFDCFSSDEIILLAGSIRKAVLKYIVEHEKADRLIIHFYKTISKKELQPIIDILHKLGLTIPVIVITINKTDCKDLLAFDMNSADKYMPLSGTMVKVGRREYLLFNNTRYVSNSDVRRKEYHFPVKINLAATQPELLEDKNTIQELIDQVYQFSRMYWKSISQQNLPVTIKYPEMVAEIYPFFQHDKLPEFGQRNLWFL